MVGGAGSAAQPPQPARSQARAVRRAMAPVGQASAQRRAAWRRPSESGAPKGTATATSKPRPTIASPSSSPASARDPHAGVAQDALAGLVDDLRVGRVLREAAPLPEEAVGVGLVLGGPAPQAASSGLAAAAAQAAARLAPRRLVAAGPGRSRRSSRGGAPRRSRASPPASPSRSRGRSRPAPRRRPAAGRSQTSSSGPVTGRAAEVLIDGDGGDPPGRHRAHREVGAQHRVAAGEDARAGWWRACAGRPRCPSR